MNLAWLLTGWAESPGFSRGEEVNFNPRLNNVYRLDVGSIPAETVEKVETEIIGY